MTGVSLNEKVAIEAQYEIVAQLHDALDQKGVKDKVLKDAREMAALACQSILDNTGEKDQLKTWEGVTKGTNGELLFELGLVYDFLKSAGFNFASNCLKYESQQPERFEGFDHSKFASEAGLCPYDRTPCLVQIIREMQRQEESK